MAATITVFGRVAAVFCFFCVAGNPITPSPVFAHVNSPRQSQQTQTCWQEPSPTFLNRRQRFDSSRATVSVSPLLPRHTTARSAAPASMQPHGALGQLASSSNGQLAQLQLPGCLDGSHSSSDHSFAAAPLAPTAPPGIAGMTSLYGKLRTQATVLPGTTADAQLSGSSSAGPFSTSAPSSTGTVAGYGWQGPKQFVAGSIMTSDTSSILHQHAPAASTAWPGRPLPQYSLFSKSSASGSHTSSRSSSRSTASSISTATAAAAPTDQWLAASFLAAASPAPAPAASAAPAGEYGVLLEALGLSGGGRAGSSTQDQEALLSLLTGSCVSAGPKPVSTPDPLAGYGGTPVATNTAQLLLTSLAPSTAPASSDLPHSHLLQQLQQLQINECAQSLAQGVRAQSSSMQQPLSSSDAAGLTPASYAAMQKQLLLVQLQDLQESLQAQCSNTSTCPGSLGGGAATGCNLLGSLDPALPLSSVTPNPALLGSSTQQEASNQQAVLAQLMAQVAPGVPLSSSSTMLATMLSSMQAQHGQLPGASSPAGLAMPSTASPSVAAVIEGLQQQLLLSSVGSALLPVHGVFDNLAAAGSLVGLLPAGKHTLQVGPGNNPMYKVGSTGPEFKCLSSACARTHSRAQQPVE